jgi:predicted PurR-regulated permease PerM
VGDASRWSNGVLAALFLAALWLFSRILEPFWIPVLLGAFVVVLFAPLGEALQRRVGSGSLAAALATAAVFAAFIAPVLAVGWMAGRELLALADVARAALVRPDWREVLAARLPAGWMNAVPADPLGLSTERVLAAVSSGGAMLQALLGAGTHLVVSLFLMAVSTYYFFLDGRRLLAELTRLLPLDRRYTRAFFKEFQAVARALFYGNVLTAFLQGLLALAGFFVAGVPHAGVWASVLTLVALIPVGATIGVWGPVAIAMFLGGHPGAGLFILGWGVLAIGGVDNFVRPKLCSARMTLHPLLVFLSLFGGVAVFGLAGLLLGPLAASLMMAMLRIYRRDFLPKVPDALGEPAST